MTAADYRDFLRDKLHVDGDRGFEPVWMPDFLFPFQEALVEWGLRKGRGGMFADCGLGKTIMSLVWAENVRIKTGGRVLILTPLAVAPQTQEEGRRFGIEVRRISKRDEQLPETGLFVTNYEKLDWLDREDFAAVVCDESSILKNFDGATKHAVTQFMRKMPYRLLCTATAAPNDYTELGTSSEALGYLGHRDMLSMFFKEDDIKDSHLGWARKGYRFRGHAEEPFWRWVCSWSRSCRKPSDVGFTNDGYQLPKLIEREVVVDAGGPRPGMLFSLPARSLAEQRQERRATINSRCEAAAESVAAHDGCSVVWCHLNDEADILERMIPGAVQISGSHSDDEKESRFSRFATGDIETLIIKPKIGAWGLNWQHCSNVVTFASHSWEQYYQSVRRCWRFGQKNDVTVTVVTSEGERGVLDNLRRKAEAADRMFDQLVSNMARSQQVKSQFNFNQTEEVVPWLAKINA